MDNKNITYDQITQVAKEQITSLRDLVVGKDQNYVFTAKASARGVYRVWEAFFHFAPSVAIAVDDNTQLKALIDSFDSLAKSQ